MVTSQQTRAMMCKMTPVATQELCGIIEHWRQTN
jgi:hypothetical protein